MSWEYLHLVLHPFPVVLALVGVATGLGGWIAGRPGLERHGLLTLFLGGVAALPAYYSGIAAADTATARTFVTPSLVQTHRSWATWATVALVTVAALAAVSLWQGRSRDPGAAPPEEHRLRRFVLSLGVAAAGLAAYAAWLGGHVIHGEPGEPRPPLEEERAARGASTAPCGPRVLPGTGSRISVAVSRALPDTRSGFDGTGSPSSRPVSGAAGRAS